MSKKNKKRKVIENREQTSTSPIITLDERKQDYIFIGIIVAILLYLFKPMVIDGLSPQGVDVIGSIGSNHQIASWQG